MSTATGSAKVIYPDTTQMVIYDPRQNPGMQPYYLVIYMDRLTYTDLLSYPLPLIYVAHL